MVVARAAVSAGRGVALAHTCNQQDRGVSEGIAKRGRPGWRFCPGQVRRTGVAGFPLPVVHAVAVKVVHQVDAAGAVLTGVPAALVHVWKVDGGQRTVT